MNSNLVAVVSTGILVLVAIGMHFEMLRFLSSALPGSRLHRRLRVAVVIVVAVATHVAEAVVFALGIGLMIQAGYGEIEGAGSSLQDVLYLSLTTYTSVGYGDIVPLGPLRIVCGVEAVAGLVLIAWTASFTYVEMQKYWQPED